VEDFEGLHTQVFSRRWNTKQEHFSTRAGKIKCALHNRDRPGSVDYCVVAIRLQLVQAAEGEVGAHFARKRQSRRILIYDRHLAGAAQAYPLQKQDADGPRSQDGDFVRHTWRQPFQPVQHTGKRLDKRAGFKGQVANIEDGFFWRGRPLCHSPHARDPDRLPVETKILAVVEASFAVVTGNVGLDGHPVARLEARHPAAHGLHYPGKLVTRDGWVTAQVFAAKDMDISAADTAGHDAHQHLARFRRRARDFDNTHLSWSFDPCRFH